MQLVTVISLAALGYVDAHFMSEFSLPICSPGGYMCQSDSTFIPCTKTKGLTIIQTYVERICPPDFICKDSTQYPCHPKEGSKEIIKTKGRLLDLEKYSGDSDDLNRIDSEFDDVQDERGKKPSWSPEVAGIEVPCQKSGFMIGTTCRLFSVCYQSPFTHTLLKMKYLSCKEGEHFHPDLQKCVPEAESGCVERDGVQQSDITIEY